MPTIIKTVGIQFGLSPSQVIKPIFEGGTTIVKLDQFEARELALDIFDAMPDTDDKPVGVKLLLLQGRHIDAIKLHRERAGVGLKEAKDYCDQLRDKLLAL